MPYGKILILDENASFCRLLSEYLSEAGMDTLARPRLDEITYSIANRAMVILLSSTLTGDSPDKTINDLRAGSNTPLILMSSYTAPDIFCSCADYIIEKPFNIDILINQIKNLLSKINKNPYSEKSCIYYKGLSLDVLSYTATIEGKDIKLPPKEIELLYLLMTKKNQIISKGELCSLVWGRILSDTRTLSVHINRIKKKIGEYSNNIVTIRGVGFMFKE